MKRNFIQNLSEVKPYFFYTAANIISVITSIILVPIITYLLPVAEFGYSSTYFTYSGVIILVATLSMNVSIDKMMIEDDKNPFDYIFSIIVGTLGLIIIYEIIIFGISLFVRNVAGLNIMCFAYMGIYFFFSSIYLCIYNYYRFIGKYKVVFWCLVVSAPIAQLSSILLLLLFKTSNFFYRVIGYELPVIILGSFLMILLFYKQHPKFISQYLKHAVKLSTQLIPHLIAQVFMSQASVIILSLLLDSESVGLFSFSNTIALVLYTVLVKLFQAWSPWYYTQMNERKYENIKRRQKVILYLSLIGLIIFNIACQLTLKYFVRSEYLNAANIIPVLSLGYYYYFLYYFFYDAQYYYGFVKRVSFISLLVSIICFLFNILFISQFGFLGAAIANALAYFILLFINCISLKKYIDDFYSLKDMYIIFLLSSFTIICISVFFW